MVVSGFLTRFHWLLRWSERMVSFRFGKGRHGWAAVGFDFPVLDVSFTVPYLFELSSSFAFVFFLWLCFWSFPF